MGLKCELKTFPESLYIIYYIILLLPQQTAGCCQNVLGQRGRVTLEVANWRGCSQGRGGLLLL